MFRKYLLTGLVLMFAAAGCSRQGPAEPSATPAVISSPAPQHTGVPDFTATSSHTVTPTVTLVPTTTQMTDEPTVVSWQPLPVVYFDRSADPPRVVLLDPLNGDEIRRIPAPGLDPGANAVATQNSFFFVDEDTQQVHRLLMDGSVQVLDFLNPDGGIFEGVVLPSPDGERVAHGLLRSDEDDGGQVQLCVVNVDGSSQQIMIDEDIDGRLARPTPIRWSGDGGYLYDMNVIEGVGGYGGLDLSRIEIATGGREVIFADAGRQSSTSVSPDERFAVRVLPREPLTLAIKDLDTGTETSVLLPPDYVEALEMVWAPDSSALLITMRGFDWVENAFGVLRVELENLVVSHLVSNDARFLRPVAWHVMETIWLNDGEGSLWRMDAASLEMTLIAREALVISYSQ